MSVGFYPYRTYQACVEFGAATQAPVVLTTSFLHVCPFAYTLRAFLQARTLQVERIFFRLQTVTGGVEPAAKFTMDRRSITLKVGELKYLLLDMPTLVRQLAQYTMSDKDVNEYVQISTASSSFVAPKETSLCSFNITCYSMKSRANFNYPSFNVCVYT